MEEESGEEVIAREMNKVDRSTRRKKEMAKTKKKMYGELYERLDN